MNFHSCKIYLFNFFFHLFFKKCSPWRWQSFDSQFCKNLFIRWIQEKKDSSILHNIRYESIVENIGSKLHGLEYHYITRNQKVSCQCFQFFFSKIKLAWDNLESIFIPFLGIFLKYKSLVGVGHWWIFRTFIVWNNYCIVNYRHVTDLDYSFTSKKSLVTQILLQAMEKYYIQKMN